MDSRIMARTFGSIFTLIALVFALGILTSTSFAQADDPLAPNPNEVIERTKGKLKTKQSPSLADQLQIAARRATTLMDLVQADVIARFTDWAERMAQVLAGAILLFSFLRVWRENSGQGSNLFWWFARLAVCLGLIGSGPWLINWMYDIGRDVAMGPSANSAVYRFYDTMQSYFNENYAKIAMGTFTVKVDNKDFTVTPVAGGEGGYLGVLYDQSSTIRDFNNQLKDTTYSLPKLFAWLGACRAILEGGDFWLAILSGVLLMSFKVLAPFMIVLGIDQKLAQRVSYPFLWGVIVLTLIWPTVSYFLRGLAYMFGNIAVGLSDADPIYAWNDPSLQAFRSAAAQPFYTVLFACFTMTITALCLWLSPVLAYQISMGRVYEGVSNAASSFAGMVVGTVADWYTANAGAKLNQEAATIQAQGSYEGESTRAGAERRAAELSNKGRWETARASAQGALIDRRSNINAAQAYQTLSAAAGKIMGIGSAAAGAELAKNDLGVRTQQQIKELGVAKDQQAKGIEVDRASDTERWKGEKVLMGSGYAGYQLRNAANGIEARNKAENQTNGENKGNEGEGGVLPGAMRIGATAIELGGGAYGMKKQYDAIQDRAAGQTEALTTATDARVAIQQEAQAGLASNQDLYQQRMTGNHQQFATDQTNAANVSASISMKGANSSYSTQMAGINRGTELESQAIQTRYEGQMQAADITRTAAIDAARLHAMERVFTAVGNKIARDIEKGMELRY